MTRRQERQVATLAAVLLLVCLPLQILFGEAVLMSLDYAEQLSRNDTITISPRAPAKDTIRWTGN